jgi:hypothetical protein
MGLPGRALAMKITEGLLLDAGASVNEQLAELRQGCIQVSLDDFGTGDSSLSCLQRCAIDTIKIDRSFVRHLLPASTNLALCKAHHRDGARAGHAGRARGGGNRRTTRSAGHRRLRLRPGLLLCPAHAGAGIRAAAVLFWDKHRCLAELCEKK